MIFYFFDLEPTAFQVGVGQCATNFEFFSDGETALRADDFKFPNATALATFKWNQVGDVAQVDVMLRAQPFGDLFAADDLCPLVEIGRFLVIVVQNLTDERGVLRVAIRTFHRREIGFYHVFPTILEFLGATAATFRKTGVADGRCWVLGVGC